MNEETGRRELYEIENDMDTFRAELSAQAERGGFEHLAEIATFSCDEAEILTAAILDVMALGIPEKAATEAVTIGIVTGSLMRKIRAAAQESLAPEVEGEQ